MRWWERDGFALPLFSGATVELYVQPALVAAEPIPIPGELVRAGEAMLGLGPEALGEITPHVWANYRAIAGAGAPMETDPEDAASIWRLVRPYTLTLQMHGGVAWMILECDCDWNAEDGLQLVLQHGTRWARVSAYDGCFTDGEARGDSRLDSWLVDPSASLPLPPGD